MNNIDTNMDPFISAFNFRSSHWLDSHFSGGSQRKIIAVAGVFLLVFGVLWLLSLYAVSYIDIPKWLGEIAAAGVILSTLVGILITALHSYYLYYRLTLPEESRDGDPGWTRMSYPAATILLSMKDADDPIEGFLSSNFGREIILRCGIYPEEVLELLEASEGNQSLIESLREFLDTGMSITLRVLVEALFGIDERFSEALLSKGVTEAELLGSAGWVQRTDRRRCKERRFWAPERLEDVTPLTQNFSYGKAYTLEKFSRRMDSEAVFLGAGSTDSAFEDDITAVLNILSRPRDANALLVGHSAGGVGDIISAIKSRLKTNKSSSTLENKQLYVLDTQALITAADESKGQFEYLLNKLLTEATLAGNIVLVIENIVGFRIAANRLSANLFGILDRYLDHPDLPIIATSSTADYHQHLEGREVMSSFGSVLVHDVNNDTLLKLLGEIAVANEGRRVCTYGALTATAKGARDLITDDEMPHAAVDLFLEILSTDSGEFIDKEFVNSYLSQKTGVPTGRITDTERASLSVLEDELKKRVIGQDAAVKAISSALRRNRAGVEDDDRPIGTFLFLGPTGVGKTETAKTLNSVYFEDSGLRRLDMSEYSQAGAVDDLRGASGESGRLADMAREKPYGVLLLDEFEKANPQVHDLFLQILDEGYFTDGRGRRVSLNNMIIIATSNAGAREIFTYVENGDDLSEKQSDIIDSVVDTGEFRPELINRFDAAIIYHPLTAEDLIQITRILLSELQQRMKEKGYRLKVADSVVQHLVEKGYNPEFGARAIRRMIQDSVENTVADKIIDNGISAGDTISLTVDDIS